jgi:hypothetical protein
MPIVFGHAMAQELRRLRRTANRKRPRLPTSECLALIAISSAATIRLTWLTRRPQPCCHRDEARTRMCLPWMALVDRSSG